MNYEWCTFNGGLCFLQAPSGGFLTLHMKPLLVTVAAAAHMPSLSLPSLLFLETNFHKVSHHIMTHTLI